MVVESDYNSHGRYDTDGVTMPMLTLLGERQFLRANKKRDRLAPSRFFDAKNRSKGRSKQLRLAAATLPGPALRLF
jgi:hypothetical protein